MVLRPMMTTATEEFATRQKFDTVTIQLKTPDGTAWIQILEFEPGRIAKVFMQIGKAGSSLNAYCAGLANLTTELLQDGKSITHVISLLQGIASDKTSYLKGGVQCKSGPEALALALLRYRSSVPNTVNDDGYRPARFTNPR